MTNTICAGRGDVVIPRLSEPLLTHQGVKVAKPIGATDPSRPEPSEGAQNHAQNLILDAAQAHWHLDLLGRDERNTNIRAIPRKGLNGSAINGNFAHDLERVQQWQASGRGIYLQPNPGGTKADQVTAGIALFFEHDDRPKADQQDAWIWLGLPQPSFQLDTGGKSIHQYFVLASPIAVDRWAGLMDRLIAYASSDPNCKGANRVMRMAGGWYIDSNGAATAQSRIINATSDRYEAELFEELLPPLPAHIPCNRAPRRAVTTAPGNLSQITDALGYIPRREAGTNTYGEYRNLLWGLIAACMEAGYSAEWAIELMEDHSPSEQCGWDVRQVAASGGEQITAGTFWWQARQHGWRGGHA